MVDRDVILLGPRGVIEKNATSNDTTFLNPGFKYSIPRSVSNPKYSLLSKLFLTINAIHFLGQQVIQRLVIEVLLGVLVPIMSEAIPL